ncbi:MAG: proteasome activator [Acidimicrobiales bacterium]
MTADAERPEIVAHGADGEQSSPAAAAPAAPEGPQEVIEQPAKIMRIGSMIRQLLEEVRSAELDEASRDRMRDIYDLSVNELAATLSPDLQDELARLTMPFGDTEAPSGPELRVAQAQLVGWLEGLFQGIQATMFAQQMMARQQLEQMRGLPPGMGGPGGPGGQAMPGQPGADHRPGTYL